MLLKELNNVSELIIDYEAVIAIIQTLFTLDSLKLLKLTALEPSSAFNKRERLRKIALSAIWKCLRAI